MSAVADEYKEDAEWLRRIADAGDWNIEDHARFNRIADNADCMSAAMFTTDLQFEKRVEKSVAGSMKALLEVDGEEGTILLQLLWLIQLRLQQGATKALFGQGLSGLGLGAVASLFGGGKIDANKEGE